MLELDTCNWTPMLFLSIMALSVCKVSLLFLNYRNIQLMLSLKGSSQKLLNL